MIARRLLSLFVVPLLSTIPHSALGQDSSSGERPRGDQQWEFFAFDNGVGRDALWGPRRQAQFLAEFGFDGIGYTGVKDLGERIAAFDQQGLRIYSLYVPFESSKDESVSPEVIDALSTLKGKGVTLWLHMHGDASDQQTADRLRILADKASPQGVRIAIYPHYGNQVATAQHALKIVQAVDRPNVGVSLNLCHELRSGNGPRIKEIIRKTAQHLTMVSINGARRINSDDSAVSWNDLIMPLGEGDFDVLGVLRELDAVGYRGPIGLQCYNIKQDPQVMLKSSMDAWNAYVSTLE